MTRIDALALLIPLAATATCYGSIKDREADAPDTALVETRGAPESVSVAAGALELTATTELRPRSRDGEIEWATTLLASREVTSATATAPQRALPEIDLYGARDVELSLTEPTLRRALAGEMIFVRIEALSESGGPERYEARLDLAPRLVRPSGFVRIVPEQIDAAYVRGPNGAYASYRARVASFGPFHQLTVTSVSSPVITAVSASEAMFAWELDDLVASATWANGQVTLELGADDGALRAQATLGVFVARFGLTARAASEVWPSVPCSESVSACVAARADAVDLEECGSYQGVDACLSGATGEAH